MTRLQKNVIIALVAFGVMFIYSLATFSVAFKDVKIESVEKAPMEYLSIFSKDAHGVTHLQTQTSNLLNPTSTFLYKGYGLIVHCISDNFETLQGKITLKSNARFSFSGGSFGAGYYYLEYRYNIDTTANIRSLCFVTKGKSRIEFQNDTICSIPFALSDAYISYNCSGKKNFLVEKDVSPFESTQGMIGYLVLLVKNKKLYLILLSPDKKSKPDHLFINRLFA